MRRLPILVCVIGLLQWTGRPGLAQDREELAEELQLQAAGLALDGPALVEFFRLRTQNHIAPEKLQELIRKLSDRDPAERSRAYRELLGLGPLAVPALRLAVSDPDGSVAARQARRCLGVLTGEGASELPALAARVLAGRRTAGRAQALLAYLPYADNEQVLAEVRQALIEAGYDDKGKLNPAILKALADESPVCRAAAIDVLAMHTAGLVATSLPRVGARAGEGGDALRAIRKLLVDPKPSVRLRAALALAQAKDPKAVSTLVLLLAELPYELAREAEDFLSGIAAEQAPKVALGSDEASRQKARDAWAEWWLQSEAPGLLDEFRKRTMTEESREKVLGLIKDLGSEEFKTREEATKKLRGMGVLVLPLLRKASAADTDPEIRKRAKECLTDIEKNQAGPLSPVIPRLVAYRKPEGSAGVLLKYLPFADDGAVLDEVQGALNAVAYQEGKPAPELLAALGDRLAARRSAAAEALAQEGAGDKELAAVRKLLQDPEATVRLRAALSLASMQDRTAVPVLIASLTAVPEEQATDAEEYLTRVAGDQVPTLDPASREKRRDTWAAWWKERGEKVRLLALREIPQTERLLGYTVLVSPNQSRVVEIDRAGKVRWEIQNLSNVWDAHFLSRNRLLLLESGARKLTERTLRGDVLWQQTIPPTIWPTACQRLRNGNTFLVSGNRMVELTRAGKEVNVVTWPMGNILYARKFKDGQTIFVTQNNSVHRLDAQGKQIKSWAVQQPTNQGIHILPNGNVLYPQQYTNRVFEYDPNGKQVWTATVPRPVSVQRLPNGNTLVASYSPYQVVELNRAGKEVWKATIPIQALRAYRR
jgi:HEAT repeat protein